MSFLPITGMGAGGEATAFRCAIVGFGRALVVPVVSLNEVTP